MANVPAKAKPVRIPVKCNECGKVWRVRPTADPQCPQCNGVDFDVRDA
jgi:Zn finger protein HypA/HybF involved in hydrogenase expression